LFFPEKYYNIEADKYITCPLEESNLKNLIATAAFGLEAIVKREVEALGFTDIKVQDGRIDFGVGGKSVFEGIPKANLWLRCSDRVLLNMGEFKALTFDELFEKTKALDWGALIPKNGKFTVLAKAVRSQLMSLSDIQSIVKKAVVEKLKQKYNIEHFEEDGPEYTIQAAILKDTVTITIDTTGQRNALHKRGYRERAYEAPLKETMAAALISLSYWKPGRLLLDPTCGSGTLAIEAALMQKNIAPGLNRGFASEAWRQIPSGTWKEERKKAYSAIKLSTEPMIYASDIDPQAVEVAGNNAIEAGVDDCIVFEAKPLSEISLPGDYGIAISNPPYGERLGRMEEIHKLYSEMGSLFKNPTWSVYVLTSDEFFEESYGKRADKKRKLFNGNIKTDYYQYFGKRPK